jgi:beta-glucosidase
MVKRQIILRIHLVLLCMISLSISCQVMPKVSKSKPLSSYDDQVKQLLSQMTLEEKIGQMIQADQEHLQDPADIEKYCLGSLLSGGNSDPKAGNSLQAWTDMYDGYQQHALKTRLGIPILYGVDAVHGHNNVIGAVIFPTSWKRLPESPPLRCALRASSGHSLPA